MILQFNYDPVNNDRESLEMGQFPSALKEGHYAPIQLSERSTGILNRNLADLLLASAVRRRIRVSSSSCNPWLRFPNPSSV